MSKVKNPSNQLTESKGGFQGGMIWGPEDKASTTDSEDNHFLAGG